jgi:poly(hydroxyalkanoate) depolymerase family esterase
MSLPTLRQRLRQALERRYSRWRRLRRATSELAPPAAAPSAPEPIIEEIAPVVPTPELDAAVDATSVPGSGPPSYAEAPELVDVPEPEPAVPPPAAPIEIVVPVAPGRFETDAELGMRGKLYDAPHKRRQFVMYIPAGWSKDRRAPLLVLCHGCKQTPEELASGSHIAQLADELGCLVLLPRQTKWANPWRCWTWYDAASVAGDGETAIIAAQIRFIRQRYRADTQRVAVAGISAGAALAAVLGLRYPRHVRAVVSVAGLACGAATSAMNASEVMRHGPSVDVEALAAEARAKGGGSRAVPLLAIHGDDDAVVAPANSIALVRQYLRFNGHRSLSDASGSAPGAFPDADELIMHRMGDGREMTTREWKMNERLVVRHVGVAGLGHAWSGGDGALTFNDAREPDATALIGRFLGTVFAQATALP